MRTRGSVPGQVELFGIKPVEQVFELLYGNNAVGKALFAYQQIDPAAGILDMQKCLCAEKQVHYFAVYAESAVHGRLLFLFVDVARCDEPE